MLRAHLIMNPEARAATPAMRRVVRAALEARFKLDVTETAARDAGIQVAREAAEAGNDFLIAFGGDGLVNEVVNGMAGSDAILAIIPGGTMNVFARNLGLPNDALEAADRILACAGRAEPQSVRLASADGRLFTFACGCGFDAEAAARVEARKEVKRRVGEPYFYAAAFATFLRSYLGRPPFLRCEGEFGVEEAVMAIASNGGPYAYLGGRPVRLGRRAPGAAGLDLFLLRRLQPWRVPTYAVGAFVSGRFGPGAVRVTSVERFTVAGREPFFIHVDGEPLERTSRVEVRPDAATLRVLV